MSFICAVRAAMAAAESSSPSHPLVLFLFFFETDEPSSVSREGDSAMASATSVVRPVVTTCAVSGGSTDSSRLQIARCTLHGVCLSVSACQKHTHTAPRMQTRLMEGEGAARTGRT